MRDYHVHTYRCKHARGDVEDYAEVAFKNGFEVLGVSDHTPLPDGFSSDARMGLDEMCGYVDAFDRARKKYSGLKMILGLECEYLKRYHNFYVQEILGHWGVKYLILGQHFFHSRGEMFYAYRKPGTTSELKAYTDHLIEGMETGLFDFVAHPDVFGVFYAPWDGEAKACSRSIIGAAQALKMPLEINGYGFRKGKGLYGGVRRYQYPLRPFWELASQYNIEVVINSDAHKPEDVVFQREATEMAGEMGLQIADLSTLEKR